MDSFNTNQLIQSSGPHLASSSRGKGSSQSPNRVEPAAKLLEEQSHLNIVPEAESAAAANAEQNYDYDIKNTDMFESQMFSNMPQANQPKDLSN